MVRTGASVLAPGGRGGRPRRLGSGACGSFRAHPAVQPGARQRLNRGNGVAVLTVRDVEVGRRDPHIVDAARGAQVAEAGFFVDAIAAIAAGLPQEGPADQCARNILRIVEGRGGCMSLPQRQQLGAMARLIAPDLRARAARYVPAIAQSLAEECTA